MPCSGSNRPSPTRAGPLFQRGRVGAAESARCARRIRSFPASRNSSSSRNCSGSPVSSRRRNAGSAELPEKVDRAPQVRLAFLAGAPPGKRLLFEALRTPDVAARTVPRMQRPDDHVEAARRKAGLHHAPAEPVDELLDRHAAQPLLDQPTRGARRDRAARSLAARRTKGVLKRRMSPVANRGPPLEVASASRARVPAIEPRIRAGGGRTGGRDQRFGRNAWSKT